MDFDGRAYENGIVVVSGMWAGHLSINFVVDMFICMYRYVGTSMDGCIYVVRGTNT